MRGGRGGHNHFMSKMWKKKKKLMAMKGALDEDGVPIKTGPGKNLSFRAEVLLIHKYLLGFLSMNDL